jgi:hypothetical protein
MIYKIILTFFLSRLFLRQSAIVTSALAWLDLMVGIAHLRLSE